MICLFFNEMLIYLLCHMYIHTNYMTKQLYNYKHVKYVQEEARYRIKWFCY